MPNQVIPTKHFYYKGFTLHTYTVREDEVRGCYRLGNDELAWLYAASYTSALRKFMEVVDGSEQYTSTGVC